MFLKRLKENFKRNKKSQQSKKKETEYASRRMNKHFVCGLDSKTHNEKRDACLPHHSKVSRSGGCGTRHTDNKPCALSPLFWQPCKILFSKQGT